MGRARGTVRVLVGVQLEVVLVLLTTTLRPHGILKPAGMLIGKVIVVVGVHELLVEVLDVLVEDELVEDGLVVDVLVDELVVDELVGVLLDDVIVLLVMVLAATRLIPHGTEKAVCKADGIVMVVVGVHNLAIETPHLGTTPEGKSNAKVKVVVGVHEDVDVEAIVLEIDDLVLMIGIYVVHKSLG